MKPKRSMKLAIKMAQQCNPADPRTTPKVETVILIDGKLIAAAYPGEEDHAEKIAIRTAKRAGADLSQSVIYTTLEPCTAMFAGELSIRVRIDL